MNLKVQMFGVPFFDSRAEWTGMNFVNLITVWSLMKMHQANLVENAFVSAVPHSAISINHESNKKYCNFHRNSTG